jgi:sirohydrochlorin ferrochelatase
VSTGIVVFAHGSRIESANEAVRAAAEQLARAGGYEHVRAAVLELGKPDLTGAISDLAKAGARTVIIVPYFLTMGLHLERDLPRLVREAGAAVPGVELTLTPPLDGHPALIQALMDRARDAQNTPSRVSAH